VVDKESKYNIILRLGDPSEDGHGKTCEFNYVFNKSKDEIFSAYKEGAKKIGFDLINEVAVEYEDRIIAEKHLKKLKKKGFNLVNLENIEENFSGGISLSDKDFVRIFLFFVEVGDPLITYKKLDCDVLDIGGYGLFY
jgi:hypothetical protein